MDYLGKYTMPPNKILIYFNVSLVQKNYIPEQQQYIM